MKGKIVRMAPYGDLLVCVHQKPGDSFDSRYIRAFGIAVWDINVNPPSIKSISTTISEEITSLKQLSDQEIAIVTDDNVLRVWDWVSNRFIQQITLPWAHYSILSSNEIAGYGEEGVEVLNLETKTTVLLKQDGSLNDWFDKGDESIPYVHFHDKDGVILCGFNQNKVMFCNKNRTLYTSQWYASSRPISSLVKLPDNRVVTIDDAGYYLSIWDRKDPYKHKEIKLFRPHQRECKNPELYLLSDHEVLCVYGDRRKCSIVDINAEKIIRTLPKEGLAISTRDGRIVSVDYDCIRNHSRMTIQNFAYLSTQENALEAADLTQMAEEFREELAGTFTVKDNLPFGMFTEWSFKQKRKSTDNLLEAIDLFIEQPKKVVEASLTQKDVDVLINDSVISRIIKKFMDVFTLILSYLGLCCSPENSPDASP